LISNFINDTIRPDEKKGKERGLRRRLLPGEGKIYECLT